MRAAGSMLRQTDNARRLFIIRSHYQMQRRWLGQAPSGKQLKSVDASWDEAKKLFYKPSLTYGEFAKRADAFRMFAFWGLIGFITVDIFVNPPKSQYWSNCNILKMPSRLMDRFSSKPKDSGLPPLPALGEDYMTDASREYHRVCNL